MPSEHLLDGRTHRPDRARLKTMRAQARRALTGFVQAVIDRSSPLLAAELERDPDALARDLWHQALVVAYRLLFLLELEATHPAARGTTEALAELVSPERPTEGSIEEALRAAFRQFHQHDAAARSLFAPDATALLDRLEWGDAAAAHLLDHLLELTAGAPGPHPSPRLAPEALGQIYEALLALEPGLTTRPMVRVRHPRAELVVIPEEVARLSHVARTLRVIEPLPAGRFFLRAGLGRKTTGAYYTPHSLARLLVQETLDPAIEALSPAHDPRPDRLLELRLLDPAMGSGHFLVEACRLLGRAVHRASRRCLEAAATASDARRRELRRRVDHLSDPPAVLTAALEEGSNETGRICRCLVLSRCLRGVDKNPLAAELAKLTLWLEAASPALPLPPLDHALRAGDSLLSPSLEQLLRLPGSGAPVDHDRSRRLEEQWERAITADDDDHQRGPLERVAAAWCGAVALDPPASERDAAYLEALDQALSGRDRCPPRARRAIQAGQGGLCFELAFPEVFRRRPGGRHPGFDAVIGNPPWDKVLPLKREFFANYDLAVLTAPTERERRPLYQRLERDDEVRRAWSDYVAQFERTRRFVEAAYRWQVVEVERGNDRRRTGGHGDSYRYFIERSWACLSRGGRLGLVLPNTFYSAQGATGVRRLLLERSSLELCLGFTNAKRLFDIGKGQRFCLVVARKQGQTERFRARFGLEHPDDLERGELLQLDRGLIERLSPGYLGFLELSSTAELEAAAALHGPRSSPLGERLRSTGIELYQELNMTTDSHRFTTTTDLLARLGEPAGTDPRREPTRSRALEAGWLVVHEKGTFRAYDDGLKERPRYMCKRSRLLEGELRAKLRALAASQCFRLAARATIHATEVDKAAFCLLPPGVVVGNSALTEASPQERPVAAALLVLGVCNSRCFNFATRLRLGTNLNQFLLEGLPFPALLEPLERFCVHQALRASCRHRAYLPLWRELLGAHWREAGPISQLPALDGDALCRTLSSLDAAVAHAYGLTSTLYREVIDEGRSPRARQATAALVEIEQGGLEAFVARHDPYHEVPLP